MSRRDRRDGSRLVVVTRHARMRARSRCELAKGTNVVNMIFAEVQRALDAGRMSKRIPHGFTYGDERPRNTDPRHLRFVFNEERSRCYPILQRNNSNGATNERSWVVLTTLTPRRDV